MSALLAYFCVSVHGGTGLTRNGERNVSNAMVARSVYTAGLGRARWRCPRSNFWDAVGCSGCSAGAISSSNRTAPVTRRPPWPWLHWPRLTGTKDCILCTLDECRTFTSPQTLAPSPGNHHREAPSNVNVNINVEFKVTLHEQVRYRGTLRY